MAVKMLPDIYPINWRRIFLARGPPVGIIDVDVVDEVIGPNALKSAKNVRWSVEVAYRIHS